MDAALRARRPRRGLARRVLGRRFRLERVIDRHDDGHGRHDVRNDDGHGVYLALDLHATSQLAFPTDVETAVYSSALYAARGQNRTSPSQDGIFSDGIQYQVPTMTADAATGGYAAELTVGIA